MKVKPKVDYLETPKKIYDDPRRPMRMIPAPKNDLVILCAEYVPSPDYIKWSGNCASCDYWAGTKCADIHKAREASEKSHNAYSHMVSSNRGISM